jgi:hypothetical protein
MRQRRPAAARLEADSAYLVTSVTNNIIVGTRNTIRCAWRFYGRRSTTQSTDNSELPYYCTISNSKITNNLKRPAKPWLGSEPTTVSYQLIASACSTTIPTPWTLDSGTGNPYDAFLFKLSRTEPLRPRCRSAANVWRKTQRDAIEAELKRRLGDLKGKKERLAPERDKIARELFSALDAEQARWKAVAVAEHTASLEAHKSDMELATTLSTAPAPADQQRWVRVQLDVCTLFSFVSLLTCLC